MNLAKRCQSKGLPSSKSVWPRQSPMPFSIAEVAILVAHGAVSIDRMYAAHKPPRPPKNPPPPPPLLPLPPPLPPVPPPPGPPLRMPSLRALPLCTCALEVRGGTARLNAGWAPAAKQARSHRMRNRHGAQNFMSSVHADQLQFPVRALRCKCVPTQVPALPCASLLGVSCMKLANGASWCWSSAAVSGRQIKGAL